MKGSCVPFSCFFYFSIRLFIVGGLCLLAASYHGRSYLGGPDYVCRYCKAVFWYDEHATNLSSLTQRRVLSNRCCKGGKVRLHPYRRWPAPLDRLMKFRAGRESSDFMRLIRSYNSMFAFSSMGVKVDDSINTGRGPYVFRINGLPSHRIGSLVPTPSTSPQFAQLYVYDTLNEIKNQMDVLDGLGGGEEGLMRALFLCLWIC